MKNNILNPKENCCWIKILQEYVKKKTYEMAGGKELMDFLCWGDSSM
jgi:hypothetical protein